RLVMVVYDLRKPLAIYFLGNGPRFGHVVHKPIAVVVVAHVVMIQPRRIGGLVWRIDMFEIPAGDNIHAIGIHHRHQQGNDILPDSLHLFGFFGGYFVGQLRVICPWASSLECMPPSIHTTARPSLESFLASSSLIRARAIFSLISRQRSSCCIFSSLEIYSKIIGRPSTVSPILTFFTRLEAASSWS